VAEEAMSDRVRTREELLAAAILDTALDAIISMDQDGLVIEFNPAAERTFGFRRADVIGRPLVDFIIPPSLREAHRRGLAHFLATGSGPVLNRRIDITALRADGTEFPVELAITPFRSGGSWLFTAYVRDIVERKEAERRLAAQHTVTRILAESASLEEATPKVVQAMCEGLGWDLGHLWRLDREAGVLRCAAAWYVSTGAVAAFADLSRSTRFRVGEGLPGRVWATRTPRWIADLGTEASFPRAEAAKQAGLHGAVAFPILHKEELFGIVEFFHHQRQEADEPLLAMLAAVGSQLGQFMARKGAEERLRRSEVQLVESQKIQAVGQLAGGIAHDFNNLLTVIVGHTELLLEECVPDEHMRGLLTEIKQSGERAASLTRQLLAFSRRQVLEQTVLDVNVVVADMEKMLRPLIGEDIELTIRLEPRLNSIKADPSQLQQVIMNLVLNARDAMTRGGQITIETSNSVLDEEQAAFRADVAPGPYVALTVRDTGRGMTDDVKTHLFEPFFTTKGVGKGTGLGLATVYGIVKQSGGYLDVESEVSRGSTFRICLPRVVEAPAARSTPVVARVRRGADAARPGEHEMLRGEETVLLAEDEDQVRALARLVLQRHGYAVLEARHGQEAIRVAGDHAGPIHLLVSDVVMPHVGGRELAERLAASRPTMRVLFMSGYTDDTVVRHGIRDAETAFLQKPFSPTALARKVREVLDAAPRAGDGQSGT
jgi:PAS domain S-box-containing protein